MSPLPIFDQRAPNRGASALDQLKAVGVNSVVYPYDRISSALQHCVREISSLPVPEVAPVVPLAEERLEAVARVAQSSRDTLADAVANSMRIFHNMKVRVWRLSPGIVR